MEPQDKDQSVHQAFVDALHHPTVFHTSGGDMWVTDIATAAREVGISYEELLQSIERLKDWRFSDEPEES